MFETHSKYREFAPLVQEVLKDKGRYNLVSLLEQSHVKELFLHDVDHPMGYQDGPSTISIERMKKRAVPLTEKDRRKLYEIAEYALREVENPFYDLSPEQKKVLLLGANQLIQNADWKYHYGPEYRRRKGRFQLERIAETYTENKESIASIKEWDAQIAENQGFYHISKGMNLGSGMIGMALGIPTMFGAAALIGMNNALNTYFPMILGGFLSALAGNYLVYPLQEIAGERKSPNTSEDLVTKRQYNFIRHPLYSTRILADVLWGLASFPLGTYFSIKSLNHNVRGCEKQDERMRILHGKKAVEYQKNTPAMIPGSKLLMKGLRKILPEKVCDVLDTPISHYLEKIPGIRDNNYYTDDGVTHPGYWKGEPTYHLGTRLERRTISNVLVELGEGFALIGKEAYKHSKRVIKKVKKNLKKSKRKEALVGN